MEKLFLIFAAAAVIQLLYFLIVFARVNFVRSMNGVSEILPPTSVVICAHNEASNLKKYLKVVLIQQHPQFEVILVNDRSTDNTIDVMVDYYTRNTNVRIVNIPPDEKPAYAGKKYALMKGIEMAKFDTIVVTDADCRPASTHWLAKLTATYLTNTQIVLGYSPYEKRRGLLNKFIRYENFISGLQYLGFAKAGMPYMGVGRNLSYRKQLFISTKPFEGNISLPTGDDDLFVNAVATATNTEVCIDKEAFAYTPAPESFSEWINRKRRHLRSGFHYKLHHRFLLFLFAFSNLLLYVLFAALMAKGFMLLYVTAVFLSVLIIKPVAVVKAYKKLDAADIIFISPLLDVFYTGYLLIVFFLLLLKPKNSWT